MTGHEKCRDCKWLSKEKSSIGRKCVAPNKVYKHYYSAFKQPCAKACKRFFEPAEKKPEETHEKHTPKARVRLIDAGLLKQALMHEYNNYRRRGAEMTMYDISYTLGEILEEFVDKAPTVKAGEQTDAKSVRSKCEADHDREWIIGCIKHDGFIKTDRFDKANQIILEALADRPTIVRCKDCKHYIVEGITTQYGWCHEYKHFVDEDDYCSYGERKEE